jgi:hypothetical protein
VLGLEEEAKVFYSTLESNATRVSSRSREFWRRAAERALNLRPDLEIDDEDDTTIGPKFLREFELERKARMSQASHPTNKLDPAGIEAGHDQGVKEEPNGLEENREASDKPDQSGTEQLHGNKPVEGEKKSSGEKDNTTYIPDQSGLEKAQWHKVADDTKQADSAS